MSRVITSVIHHHYDDLVDAVRTNVQLLAGKMFAAHLISKSVLRSPSVGNIILEFTSVLSFMDSLSEIEQHCAKFLSILTDIGGLCTLVSERLKMIWTEVSRAECGVELGTYFYNSAREIKGLKLSKQFYRCMFNSIGNISCHIIIQYVLYLENN